MDQRHSHRDRLETELVDRYRIQRAHASPGTLMGMPVRTLRRATLGLVLVIGAVACTTPTTTDMEVGTQLDFTIPAGSDEAAVSTVMDDLDAIIGDASARAHADDVAVILRSLGNGTHEVRLTLWGDRVDTEALRADLASRFVALRDADVTIERLHTEVQESLFAKLSREVFAIEVSGASDEERRAAIMQQLHDGGHGDVSDVRVETGGGRQTYQIDIEGDGFTEETTIRILGDEAPTSIELPTGEVEGKGTVEAIEVRKKGPE